jgi:nucleoside-diphosphate-sugar epimerase
MILVTGGTGMLGAHLLYKLVENQEKVRAIYRTEDAIKKTKNVFDYDVENGEELFSKIEWCKADITDVPSLEKAFADVTNVYHVAAKVSFDESDAKQMRKVNIYGTANVVNFCVAFGVKKLCFVSSIAAIAKSVEKDFIDEDDEFNVETNNYSYAITKYGAEMEVWRGAQEGLDVVVVNPGVILGPGFWKENSGTLFSMIYKKSPFYTEGVTAFIGGNDVVKTMMAAMKSAVVNERFILSSENKSFKDVLFAIADNLNVGRPKIKVTSLIAAIGWRLSWLKSKLTGGANSFPKHTAKSANNKSYYTSEKVKTTFQIEFEKMDEVIAQISKQYLIDISKK